MLMDVVSMSIDVNHMHRFDDTCLKFVNTCVYSPSD
jgi:hypothetical protein